MHSRRERASLVAAASAALLAISCVGGDEGPESPRPESVDPGSGFAALSVRVVIRGEGFLPRPSEQQSGGGGEVETRHRVWLDDVELGAVAWVDTHTLEATVPAGLSVGPKRLVVENAFGLRGALDGAFTVIGTPTPTLEVTLAASPATFNVGQPATVTFTVRNGGGAAARDVVPDALVLGGAAAAGASAVGPSPASVARLEPGASAFFTWTVTAAAPGALTLGTRAQATDDLTSAGLASAAAEAGATVQVPAQLAATVAAGRATANVGQPVPVTLTLTNGGAARADVTAVTPGAAGPAATCGAVSPPLPQSVEAGGSLVLGWTCTASAAGTLSLGAAVVGQDGTSGAELSVAPALPAEVAVQAPAALAATVAVAGNPTVVAVGAPLAVSAAVTDTGEAGASLTRVDPVVTPPSAATCGAATPSPPQAVAGLATVTFGFSCTALVAGSFALSARVAGADANTGEALAAAPAGVPLRAEIPAVLLATVAASRSTVDVGQAVTVAFTLINGGTAVADITAVTPAASGTATATCGASSPATASIAGGASRTFTWTCTASAPGSLVLTGTATGTDGASGGPLSVTPALAASVTAQTPPVLAVSSFVSTRAVAVTNQGVDVRLVLANAGEGAADLVAVVPSMSPSGGTDCTAADPAPPQRIAGGTSLELAWSCTASAPGSYGLRASVTATDANTGALLAPAVTPLPLTVQAPAALAVESFTAARTTADLGQAVGVTLAVRNGGGTAATVTAVTPSMGATPGCAAATPATPQELPAGGTLTFTWSCSAATAGSYPLGAVVAGVDALTGAPLSATATPVALTVQRPVTLTASIAVAEGTSLVLGQVATVTLTVSNTGEAAASLTAVSPLATGAAASCGPVTPALPRTVAGGASDTFGWTCTPGAVGALALAASVTGTDLNSGATASAAAAPVSITVVRPAALAAAIAVAGGGPLVVGQAASVTLTVSNTGDSPANVTAVSPSATGVAASCGPVTPALPQTLAGGASGTFGWTCTPGAAGELTLGATVAGNDAITHAALAADAAPGVTRSVVTAAGLAVTSFGGARGTANTGQAVGMTLVVANGGGSAARIDAVTPTSAPAASCGPVAQTFPQSLPAGGSLTFTWSCSAATAASYALGAEIDGVDAATSAPLAASAGPFTLLVQRPAALGASVAAPAGTVVVGQAVSVTLTVENTGGAAANVTAVSPSAAGVAAGCGAVTPALPRTLAGGASDTFGWTCTPAAAGQLVLSATVAGNDANTEGALAADAAPGVTRTVVAGAGLAAGAVTAARTTANTGQAVGMTLVVTNGGGTTARIDTVTLTSDPPASCGPVSQALPRNLAAGASVTFTWDCSAPTTGTYGLGASVAGADTVTAAPLSAAAAPAALTVQSPASLVATLAADGADTVALGAAVGLSLTVTNLGTATADLSEVRPSRAGSADATCTGATPAPSALGGGASTTFAWTCTATRVGNLVLDALVRGTDANTGAALEASASPEVTRTVVSGTALSVASFTATPSLQNTGQPVSVTLVIANGGQNAGEVTSIARDMTPSGTSSCTGFSPSVPRDVPAGGEVTFTWTCTATAAGSYEATVTVGARDAAGDTVSLPVTPAPVTVQVPGRLAAATVQPSRTTADQGQDVGLTLELTNSGGAPVDVTAVAPSASAGGTCGAPSPAPPQTIASGASATFTWTCSGSTAGSLALSASVTASDAGTGVSASPTVTGTSVLVQTPAALAATLAADLPSVPVGDAGGVTLVLENTGQATARVTGVTASVSPEGATCGPASTTPSDIAGGTSSSFTWTCTGTSAGTYDLGAAVVAQDANTGAALTVVVPAAQLVVTAPAPAGPAAAEVVLVAEDPLGDGTAEPLLGEVDGAVWVGPGRDGLTVAWLDPAGVEAPALAALEPVKAEPLAVAVSAKMTAVSAAATAEAEGGAGGVGTLLAVEGIVYAADAGGIARSGTAAEGVAAWLDVTPSDPAWWARASVAVEPATASAPWPARDRAVPAMVASGRCGDGPCLLAARNVVGASGEPPVAAQLWRCAPAAAPGACRAEDWSLAAPDPEGPLTRLGQPASGPLTVLAVTPHWVYVGLDGPGGVRLFRAAAAPRTAAELLGRAGCAAGTSGCEGLGGDGLGARSNTRFLDAKVLFVGGATSLWLVAGDGVGPARVYRVVE